MSKHSLDSSAINYEPKTSNTVTTSPLKKKSFTMNRFDISKKSSNIGRTPIKKVNLPKGINAEANNDGSILVDKKLKGKELRRAVNHEKVHLKQIRRGDLNYDDNNVFWKGKKYSRSKMKEGDPNLPWEKEAYKKQNKKQ
jgi:hypothetical protein